MNVLLRFFKKSLKPIDIDVSFTKINCWCSLIIAVSLLAINSIIIFLLKSTQIYMNYELNNIMAIDRILLGASIFIPAAIIIASYLMIFKQPINTIGIKKEKNIISLLLVLPLVVFIYIKFATLGLWGVDLIGNTIFYVIFIGFYEEVIFRGFLWPRMNFLFGKIIGVVISGILFGLFHVPMSVLWFDSNILMATINVLGMGVVGQVVYGYLYSRTDNIIFPSLIHGMLDLMTKL